MTTLARAILRNILLGTGILLLCACATSRPVAHFTLSATPAIGMDTGPGVAVEVGPFTLPGYLRRPQLVTRTSATAVDIDEFSRWAEDLDTAFTRTLTESLQRSLGWETIAAYPAPNRDAVRYRLRGSVQRFDNEPGGDALLDVQWELFDGATKTVHRRGHSRITAPFAASAGAGAYVAALNATLAGFSAAMSDVLRELAFLGGAP